MNNIIGTIEDSSMKVVVEIKDSGPQGPKGDKGDKGDPSTVNNIVAVDGNIELTANDIPYDEDTSVQGAIDELRQQTNTLDADVVAHKAEKATETEYGHVRLADLSEGKRVARFTIGTTQNGWTAGEVDYLCDGVDDQEEIIQALNDLPATGGEIVILDGIYDITASINIPKDNVSLRGNGNATILKRMYDSTDADSGPTAMGLITLNEKSGCKIQGLQIDGNKTSYTDSNSIGIFLSSSNNNTVTGNTCNNNIIGICLLLSSNDNTVTGNICTDNSISGITLYESSNDNTVTGNTCNNSNFGISLSSSNNNTVIGNTCTNNSDPGIDLYGSNNNTIIGNTCTNNSNGISPYESNNNTIIGNTCTNNNYAGINLYKSSNTTVTGNTCTDNNNSGIYLYGSSNNTVTGNTCTRGIGTPEDYTTNQYTILLFGTGNNYNLISSNNCMGKAVVVEGGTGNSAWGNKFDATDDLP